MSRGRRTTGAGRRRGAVLLLLTGTCIGAVLAGAPAADAHPLGNATINHYDGLRLYPDHLADNAVVDTAEIPTLQRKPLIDGNRDGRLSTTELTAYADQQCRGLAATDRVTVGGARLELVVEAAGYEERPGAIGLSTGRLVCRLAAPADLSRPATVGIDDEWDGAGIGWHELTAVGIGVSLHDSPVPARSVSDALRRYPDDLLSSPLDQRSATIEVSPGGDASTYAGAGSLPGAGAASRFLNGLATTFNGLVGRRHLTAGVGLLALMLAMVLGAGHALLPGHGKTIMAAYLVGKRGRYRDVAAVGLTVTLTHTAGVLVIGLLLSLSASLAPTVVEQALAVASGLIVAGVGLWLLTSTVRHRRHAPVLPGGSGMPPSAAPSDVPYLAYAAASHHEHHHHEHDHQERHHHEHRHPLVGPHDHRGVAAPGSAPLTQQQSAADTGAFSRKGLVGLGVAGGLVPSPSALLVLLAAVALGRTAFGIVLVLGYGLGMAGALGIAGLLLVRLHGRLGQISTRLRPITWVLSVLPVLTACLVLAVGVGLVLRALGGTV